MSFCIKIEKVIFLISKIHRSLNGTRITDRTLIKDRRNEKMERMERTKSLSLTILFLVVLYKNPLASGNLDRFAKNISLELFHYKKL